MTAETKREIQLLAWAQAGVIGQHATLDGPFGPRPLRYFDYTASGRCFAPIEELIRERVLPMMANTHTEASTTGRVMNRWYDQAHQSIARHLNAGDDDVVIFTGSGCTAAINHLIYAMGLRLPASAEGAAPYEVKLDAARRPVIFTSLMEHHSNDLAWRETIGELVYVGFDDRGRIDLDDLDAKLARYADRPLKLGTFTLASNVTGAFTDQVGLAQVLHRHDAWALFDAAAAAPYVELDMHPPAPGGHMDAVFISPHKFLGGPQTPGLLVANKALFSNYVPVHPGGGTVLWVYPDGQRYVSDIQKREEAGTPPIVQVLRAALAFDLKATLGVDLIRRREEDFVQRAIAAWRDNPELILLGDLELPRLGVISVIFKGMHHALAVRLLSDLYGIQARGGCMCAGPYGHVLLDIDEETSKHIRCRIDEGHAGDKPGWVRFGFSPATEEADFVCLLDAVNELSHTWREHADRYVLDDEHGEFRLKQGDPPVPALRLGPPAL